MAPHCSFIKFVNVRERFMGKASADCEKEGILTLLHNINRQSVKANKFILGRLGENQP